MKMHLSRQLVAPVRLAEIAALAEAVAEEHSPTAPVDVEAIARAKEITLSFGQYGEAFDGMLEYKVGRWHIYCNLDRLQAGDAPRARFTLAHELGHYFLDEHRNALAEEHVAAHRSQCEYESPNLAEQEADHFAANLLMPEARFVRKARGVARGLGGVLSLAEHFGTSITSTAIRYAAADVSPCAVVKWTWRRLAWKRLSSATFQARLGRTVQAPDQLVAGSPTARALAREAPPASGYFEAGTTASAWFPRVAHDPSRDAVFIEQAIPLGRYGVLTLLSPESGRLA